MRNLFLFLVFFASIRLAAQTSDTAKNRDDIVALNDGIILRGKIVRQQSGVMIFEDNVSGEITIKNSRIKWFASIDPGKTYRVLTTTSTNYYGKLVSAEAQAFQLETSASGIVSIPYNSVKSVELIIEGKAREPAIISELGTCDPLLAQYVVSPSAIPVERGLYYYHNFMLIGTNSISYSISDHVSIGGGVLGIVFPYLYMRSGFKVGDNSYLGASLGLGSTFIDAGVGLGVTGTYTYGNEEKNISAGIAYGAFAGFGSQFESPESPVFTLSGIAPIGKRALLVTENWIIPGTFGAFSQTQSVHTLGLRIRGNRGAMDFGLSTSPIWWGDILSLIPYAGYTYKF
ncbi:MAG: hypothetical protein FD123_1363 [Bacteroidetes bacterium]|nr:MAG: hypothetical protein FD123_1363 [Bacteroidota bacterium]